MKNAWYNDTNEPLGIMPLRERDKPALPFINTGVMPAPIQTNDVTTRPTSLGDMAQNSSDAPKPIVVSGTDKKDDTKTSPNGNTDMVKKALEISKANMNGVLIGAGVGVLYCFVQKKNYMHGALLGGVLGGLTSYSYHKIKSK
jgi:hypothetical protein